MQVKETKFYRMYYYIINNKIIEHNENGPSTEYFNGDYVWKFHGKLHRLNGYALNIYERCHYFVSGIEYSEGEYLLAVERYKLSLICK